jgi:hypothetical protein
MFWFARKKLSRQRPKSVATSTSSGWQHAPREYGRYWDTFATEANPFADRERPVIGTVHDACGDRRRHVENGLTGDGLDPCS